MRAILNGRPPHARNAPLAGGRRYPPGTFRPETIAPSPAGGRANPAARGPVVLAALLVVVAAAYWPAIGNGFVFDDGEYIVQNPMLARGLDGRMLAEAFRSTYACNWHPLTWISHAVDVELFGFSPAGHHVVNVLLHLANVALLFLLLRRMTGAFWRSLLVAALFGLHPLNVESVAWASQRKTLLSTLFALAAIVAYASYARRPGLGRYALVAAALALSFLCKAMPVTLPFLLLLLDFWPLGRWGRGLPRLLLEKLPLFLLAAASCAATLYAQQRVIGAFEKYPLWSRAANAVLSYGLYLGKTLVPRHLCVLYPHPGREIPWPATILSGLVLLVVSVLAIRTRKSRPALAVGWLWFLGSLVPVIGFVQVGLQGLADRYAYLPLAGVFTGIVFLAGDSALRRPRAVAAAAFAVLATLAGLTFRQTGLWRDGLTLFGHAIAVDDRNWLAHYGYAVSLNRDIRRSEVIRHLERTVELNPDFSEACAGLGLELSRSGRPEEAQRWLSRALTLSGDRSEIVTQVALGFGSLGRTSEAIALLARAIELDPRNPEAYLTLGWIYAALGRHADAVPCIERAIEIRPTATAEFTLGISLEQIGRRADAAARYERSLELDPSPGNPAREGLRRVRVR